MSCYIVSTYQIDLMVKAAMEGLQDARISPAPHATKKWNYGGSFSFYDGKSRVEITRDNANEIGQMLLDANYASVNARYKEADLSPKYTYKDPRQCLTIPELLKCIDNYKYQACEFENWETCKARMFCNSLFKSTATMVDGYEAAPWGFSKPVRAV